MTESSQRVRTSEPRPSERADRPISLTERQSSVLRALVAAYVGEAAPVGSATLSHLLSVKLSPASIRNTLTELTELGLIEKPHASSGRLPTPAGLRHFVDTLLDPVEPGRYERGALERSLDAIDAGALPRQVSQLLSDYTHQLGFALAPRVDRLVLSGIRLVRVSSERVLAILIGQKGEVWQRVLEDEGRDDSAELERIGRALGERVAGGTLDRLRTILEAEREALQSAADRLCARIYALGTAACASVAPGADELVIATRLALLDQPEFADPGRIRGLFTAIERNERLLEVLHGILEGRDLRPDSIALSLSLGEELGEPALRDCALVAIPYGGATLPDGKGHGVRPGPAGVLGVIGPQRMDYARIIPLVSYCSRLVTQKLGA